MKKTALASALLLTISGGALAATQANEASQPTFGAERTMKYDGKHKKHHAERAGFSAEEIAVSHVASLKEMKDDQLVVLEGFIEQQVGKDDFVFKDDSGSVEVEIDDRAWHGQSVTPKDKVKLFGEVDQSWNKTEVEIHRVVKVQ
ncbi:hypothetical protein OA57_10205 [Chelonobacter oris]|uniref:Uncharacterized protein n=2 Tax=Chelonobacter oris TaxID=505317 RepID=A0A0A3ARN1_9PAST|nr:hypothetical protein OA57_10205 [Chelonobacter oris]